MKKESVICVAVGVLITIVLLLTGSLILTFIKSIPLLNWYYIFSIIGVFVTLGAIVVALNIPKTIATRQDKMALFEKRFAVYTVLKQCQTLKNQLSTSSKELDSSEIYHAIIISFEQYQFPVHSNMTLEDHATYSINCVLNLLETGEFLFEFDTTPLLEQLKSNLLSIATQHLSTDDLAKKISTYSNTMDCINTQFIPEIQSHLDLYLHG